MKTLPSEFMALMSGGSARRNLRIVRSYVLLLLALVAIYTVVFHVLMVREGQDHSWATGVYWTLTVMSTLGFGDITFHSDAGRIFSIVVLVSGVMFLLILLPFTFIQFFYAPWLEAQSRARAPRRVPEIVSGHVILSARDPVSEALSERLHAHGRKHFVIEPDLSRALELHDLGVPVIVGERDDADTWRRVRVADAALVVATGDDYANSSIAFTVREVAPHVPLVAFARAPESIDLLELAGASQVLQLTDMLGRSLARRTIGGDVRANVIGRFDELLIAEAPVMGTPMVGRTLGEGWLRGSTGLTVIGLWARGRFEVPTPATLIEPSTVLVLAGSEAQLDRFSELTAIYSLPDAPMLILGGGRVGRAVARSLRERGVDYRIVEMDPGRVHDREHTIIGNAADIDILEKAGIREAPSALVTTADDATNIYLTIYCRRLRPDMQIISRATLERNVSTLHRAGADFVMSYASMGANAVFNILEGGDIVMVAEGLNVFRLALPEKLRGVTLRDSGIRAATGVSVVAIEMNGKTVINPPPDEPLPDEPGAELILAGTMESESAFLKRYA